MAGGIAEFIIRAKDEATAVINAVSNSLQKVSASGAGIKSAGINLAIFNQAIQGLQTAQQLASTAIQIFGGNLAAQVETLDKLAAKTGVAIEPLQVLQHIIRDAGGDADGLNMAFVNLNRSIATNDPLLAQLGVTSKDTFGAFIQLAEAFSTSDDTAKKTEIAMRLLGKAGADLVGLMPELVDKFSSTDEQMRRSGELIGDGPDGLATKARKLDEQMDRLSNNWSGFMNRMQSATIPHVNSMVREFNHMWDAINNTNTPEKDAAYQIDRLQETIDATKQDMERMQRESNASGDKGTRDRLRPFIEERQHVIEALEKQIKQLKGISAETEDAEQDLLNQAIAGEARSGGIRPDAIAGVVIDKKVGPTERERRIKELKDTMKITQQAAEALLVSLDKIDADKKKSGIVESLIKNNAVPENVSGGGSGIMIPEPMTTPDLPILDVSDQIKDINDKIPLVRNKLEELTTQWKDTVRTSLEWSNIMDNALTGTHDALEQGFSTVFTNLLSEGQTFGSAMKTIATSVANAWLQELARIAAAKVFMAILNFATGGLFGAGAASGAGSGTLYVPTPASARRSRDEGMQINIYAIDRAGVTAAFEDPRGTIRRGAFINSLNRAY